MSAGRQLCAGCVVAIVLLPLPGLAMSLQPKVGDSITQSQLFAYLFTAPQPGDWLRYRLNSGSDTIIFKTVGFGQADAANNASAYIEITTASIAILSAPTMQSANVGGSLVWKMYVDAKNFNDPLRLYSVKSSAFKIGDGLFRLRNSITLGNPAQPVPLQTLLWSGLVPLDDARRGVVASIRPQDLRVRGRVLHCTDVAVDFPESSLPAGGRFPAERIEAWQSPDVPLGSVKVQTSVMGRTYDARLIAFGRGDYRPVITQSLDSMPAFPGSN